jgi:hypothetical protein
MVVAMCAKQQWQEVAKKQPKKLHPKKQPSHAKKLFLKNLKNNFMATTKRKTAKPSVKVLGKTVSTLKRKLKTASTKLRKVRVAAKKRKPRKKSTAK